MNRRWLYLASLLLLCRPDVARADAQLGSVPQAVFDALPTWLFAIFSSIFNGLFGAFIESAITAIDINGDGM